MNQVSTQIAEFSPTQHALAVLTDTYANVVWDVSTTKGLAIAKEARAEIRSYRTALEDKRVELKDEHLQRCREIDGEAKRIRVELEKLEEPIHEVIKAKEAELEAAKAARIEAEAQRMYTIEKALTVLRELPLRHALASPHDLQVIYHNTPHHSITVDVFQERHEEAQRTHAATVAALQGLYIQAKDREIEAARILEERAELAALRAQMAKAQEEKDVADKAERERHAEQLKAQQKAEDDARQSKFAAERAEAQAKRDEENRIASERRAADEAAAKVVSDANAAEAARLAAERKEIEDAQAKLAAEVEAAKPKPTPKRAPTLKAMLGILAAHYSTDTETVGKWLAIYYAREVA